MTALAIVLSGLLLSPDMSALAQSPAATAETAPVEAGGPASSAAKPSDAGALPPSIVPPASDGVPNGQTSGGTVTATTPPQAPAPGALAQDAIAPAPTGIGALTDELSPVRMFLNADFVVKGVMIGLALASVLTWTVWLFKTIELSVAKRRARDGLRALRAARTLSEVASTLRGRGDAAARLLAAAESEVELSADGSGNGFKERLNWELDRTEAAASRRIALGMGLLATVGAVAPFVGLFGTVWGIMNSFIGISRVHTTSLAVVAPGIAEALLATATGLVAAIPAVVIYNGLARAIGTYRAILRDVSVAVLRLVSRDLDRPATPISSQLAIADAPDLSISEAAE